MNIYIYIYEIANQTKHCDDADVTVVKPIATEDNAAKPGTTTK